MKKKELEEWAGKDADAPWTFTLELLRTEGADALLPDEAEEIVAVKLRHLEHASFNAWREVTAKTADDLFQCAAAAGRTGGPCPAGGELRRAALAFFFADAPGPRVAEIVIPGTLRLEFPEDEERVLRFLGKRGFIQTRPHPGPLPEGEGESFDSRGCGSHPSRSKSLPLPGGEGRGKGDSGSAEFSL